MFRSLSKKKHQYTVCYFQRSRLSVYVPARKEVAVLDFPPTILADITVVDREQFTKAITKLLAQYKIDAGPVLIVLGTDVCFIHEIELGEVKDKKPVDEVVKDLRTSMPYSNVFARVIHLGKREICIALNREFYEPLLAVFREEGFDVTTLVPEIVLEQPLTETGLTAEVAVVLAQIVDKLEEFDLLESQDKPQFITTSAQTPEQKKRTLLLAGVFVVLTLILVGVWWWSNRSQPPVKPNVPVVPVVSNETLQPVEAIELDSETDQFIATDSASVESASYLPSGATGSAAESTAQVGNKQATSSTQSGNLLE